MSSPCERIVCGSPRPREDRGTGDVRSAAGTDQCRPRETRGDEQRMDPAADRHPRAPHRRRWPGRRRTWRRKRRWAIVQAGITPETSASSSSVRRRPTRFFPAPRARSRPRLARSRMGIRPGSGVFGVHLRDHVGIRWLRLGPRTMRWLSAPTHVEHHRLQGPDDLRTVRRRRRSSRTCHLRDRTNLESSTSRTRPTAAAARRFGCPQAAADAGVARDRRPGHAFRETGRTGRLQVRRAETQEISGGCSSETACRVRPRFVRLAPGESPHHRGGRRAARNAGAKVVINLERFGNTTGATIPLALADRWPTSD